MNLKIFILNCFLFHMTELSIPYGLNYYFLLFMELWAAAKRLLAMWRCHQHLSGFLAKGDLPRVSRQSANDVVGNAMIPESGRRSPYLFLSDVFQYDQSYILNTCIQKLVL